MALAKEKKIERSVDSVARIYAVIIGLALSESVKTLIVKSANGDVDLSPATFLSGLPAFVAFVVTLVPFWHGMNRHLDRCYLEEDDVVEGAMLFDFSVFFVEASILLVAGWTLRAGLVTYACLGIVLILDVIWGFISNLIHKKSHSMGWAIINVVAIGMAFAVMKFHFDSKPQVLMVIAILRSIADYSFGWRFYFPKSIDPVNPPQYAKYRVIAFLQR